VAADLSRSIGDSVNFLLFLAAIAVAGGCTDSTVAAPDSHASTIVPRRATSLGPHYAVEPAATFSRSGSGYSLDTPVLVARIDADRLEVAARAEQPVSIETVALVRGDQREFRSNTHFEPAAGGTLRAQRGMATEELVPLQNAVMQQWRFDTMPAGDGDLTVEVAIRGEEFAGLTNDGAVFGHDRGAIRYGSPFWIERSGRRTQLPMRWESGHIAITVPSSVLAATEYPATLDPTIGPEHLIIPSTFEAAANAEAIPAATWNGSEFFVVVPSRGGGPIPDHLYAHRLSSDGTLLNRPPLTIREVRCRSPQLYWAGSRYDLFCADGETIRLHRISPTFSLESTTVVSTAATPDGVFAVARNDTGEYLVVWGPRGSETDIHGTRVDLAGSVLDSPPLAIATGPGYQGGPTAAWLGGTYHVAYTDDRYVAAPSTDVRSTLVSRAGVVSNPDGDIVEADARAYEGNASAFPKAGGGGLLIWSSNGATRFRELAVDGSFAWPTHTDGPPRVLTPTTAAWNGAAWVAISNSDTHMVKVTLSGPGIIASTDLATGYGWPALAMNGTAGLVAWKRGSDVMSGVLSATGLGATTILSYIGTATTMPRIDSDGTGYVGVLEDARGRLTVPLTAQFDLAGTPLRTTVLEPLSWGRRFLSATDSGYLVVQSEGRDELRRIRLDRRGERLGPDLVTEGFQITGLDWNGTHHLTVLGSTFPRVHYRRMDSSGVFIDAGYGSLVTPGDAWDAVTAADGGDWFIVWRHSPSSGSTETDVLGARVGADGSPLDRDVLVIADAPGAQNWATVAGTGSGWIVAWADLRPGDSAGVYFRRVDSRGTLLGSSTRIAPRAGMEAGPVRVRASAGVALLAWQETRFDAYTSTGAIRGVIIDVATGSVGPAFDIVEDPVTTDYTAPSLGEVASVGGQQFLVSYTALDPPARIARAHVRAVHVGTPLGTACLTDADCVPNLCVDGVCCASACPGGSTDCRACSVVAGSAVDGLCLFAQPDHTCRAVSGDCDAPETCTGLTAECPADAFAAVTTTCRPGTTPCDEPELCTGSSGDCPIDGAFAAGTTCRESTGLCDAPEACDGTAFECPPDGPAPDGTTCDDGLVCNGSRACMDGACTMPMALVCDDANPCTADACVEPSGCASAPIEGCCLEDADCDDADDCTTDRCSAPGGTCAFDSVPSCGIDGGSDAGSADAGAEPDAGHVVRDSGLPDAAQDGGPGGSDSGGCGCAANTGSERALVPLLIVVLVFTRTRRKW
jgi:hypothetical protein